jgi:hypothetical protein
MKVHHSEVGHILYLFAVRDTIKSEVEMMEDMRSIEPSSSHYASSPVIVKKPDGSNDSA